ncbi:MerR family transcriptional regulator [Thiothrix sp.]|jgi:DNA-binding transcriptional MerR regulator|uniref:MerR family transcriptional regulator n=1 Tax=Thiothrix sp. TaxID=1032 RepID=UPI0034459897
MQEAVTPNSQLPPIPGKRYFTIGEVSDLCGVKTHVLRYWEQEFPSLKPMKRRGNRRYYQREDVLLIRQIRGLLYENGYTISGARQKLMDDAHLPPVAELPLEPIVVNGHDVAPMVVELERILFILKH